ncbi:hypothetical protein LX32DRAFT_641604 [Colletotrichum zoysiae]|uniref:Uncharacterized protein n=1 Tax=Colletotrichum zoysiae TaxID=1216348 RepID=A0AAD9M2R5_9PEZI|nr:hypothetical protein LX32DRAFT_641604 [Colletotrichum zoysiae]
MHKTTNKHIVDIVSRVTTAAVQTSPPRRVSLAASRLRWGITDPPRAERQQQQQQQQQQPRVLLLSPSGPFQLGDQRRRGSAGQFSLEKGKSASPEWLFRLNRS